MFLHADTISNTSWEQMLTQRQACAGFDLSGTLPEGFSGALPDGFSGVLPPLSPGEDPAAPVYVLPIHPPTDEPRKGLGQRAAAIWKRMHSKMFLRKQEDRCELASTAAGPGSPRVIGHRERAAVQLSRAQQQQAQGHHETAFEDSETYVVCACF